MAHDNDELPDNGGEICIAIDPGSINLRSLELAVVLAERFKRGLRGLVVARSSLQAVAQLPFTTEVVKTTGEERELIAEKLELRYRSGQARVQRLLEESTARRRVRFRFEARPEDQTPLSALLADRRDLFLPAVRDRAIRGGNDLARIKWVYDNSRQSHRALEVLRQLVAAGQTRSVFIIATGSVPRGLLADLSAIGARVYWVVAGSDDELLARIRSAPRADLTLASGHLVERIGERRLAAITRELVSPLLIVG